MFSSDLFIYLLPPPGGYVFVGFIYYLRQEVMFSSDLLPPPGGCFRRIYLFIYLLPPPGGYVFVGFIYLFIYYLRQEVMFSSDLFIYLSVCQQDCAKTYKRIWMKLCG